MRIYDLAFSLGANCSAAHNLEIRRLRPFALPFDWVYFTNESTIRYLATALRTRFSDLLLRENLIEITPDNPEWMPSHKGFLKFFDQRSGYRFVNHFRQQPSDDKEYENVYSTLRRRINRLFSAIDRGTSFLIVLGTRVQVSREALQNLQAAFMQMWPGKRFDLEVLQFNSEYEGECNLGGGIVIHATRRDWNAYDTEKTNFEWRFLDDVKSRTKPLRTKFSFHLLPHLLITVGWKKC